jgi:uncharacterized protein (TIGR04255 family)
MVFPTEHADEVTEPMNSLPFKLRDDAIVEALLEIRFDCSEIQELLVGRLSEFSLWEVFPTKNRVPFADIPLSVRVQDPALKFQPVVELWNEDQTRVVKLGEHVISYHVLVRYPGWSKLKSEIEDAIETLFQKLQGLTIRRIGLRYVNVFYGARHGVQNVYDLNLSISIADITPPHAININYLDDIDQETMCLVRIASPDFMEGERGAGNAIVDIDVHTKSAYKGQDSKKVLAWVEKAHTVEKRAFFRILGTELTNKLQED